MDTELQTIEAAVALHKNNDLAQAKDIYEGLLLKNDNNADVLHNLAVLNVQQSRVEEADNLFAKLFKIEKISEIHYLSLISFFRQNNQYDLSKQAAIKGLNLYSESARIRQMACDLGIQLPLVAPRPPLKAHNDDEAFNEVREVVRDSLARKDYLRAMSVLFKGLKVQPDNKEFGDQLKVVRSALTNDDDKLNQQFEILLRAKKYDTVKQLIKDKFNNAEHSFQLFSFLATANIATNDLKKARACLEAMNMIEPNSKEVLFTLGNVNFELDNNVVAISCYGNCISLDQSWPPPVLNLANVHRSNKNYQAAITLLRALVKMDDASEDGLINLAICLLEQNNNTDEVEALIQRALEINPKNILALNTLANYHKDLENYKSAECLYRTVIELDQNFPAVYSNLGTMLLEQDKVSEAIAMFELSLNLDENQNDVRKNLAIALKDNRNLEASEEQFRKVIDRNHLDTQAYRYLTHTRNFSMDDEFTKKIQDILLSENLTLAQSADLNFALATILESNSNYGEAYTHLVEGNVARGLDLGYSFLDDVKCFDEARELHHKLATIEGPPSSILDNDIVPIFIIGMPRSGTTLIEQVISSHRKVHGCGELQHINLYYKSYISLKDNLNSDDLIDYRRRYLNGVAQKFGDLDYFTDKMPHNFLHVPLISKCFPTCKIIHVKRDPVATCFSNFKQYFSVGLGYSYDLENLKQYYLLYEKLLKEWELYYCDKIYSVKYEDFVAEPDSYIKGLIDYLNLPWDPACLAPENNKRSVRTASQHQVRKKIYNDSSKGWQNFQNFLPANFLDFGSWST